MNWLRQLSPGTRLGILLLVTAALLVALALWPRIPQPPAYSIFADQRTMLGVPRALDVLSNLPFALVGLLGVWLVERRGKNAFLDAAERRPWGIFFLGVFLSCFGSIYYHLAPDNARLLWDRLPITMAFMAFLAAMVGERVNLRAGLALLGPLVALGVASILYWSRTELQGVGDLRPYLFVQFFPVLSVLLILLLYPPRYTRGADVLAVVGLYVAAKVFEVLDQPIFDATGVVSGHTLKHLFAALAALWILRMLWLRRPVPGAA